MSARLPYRDGVMARPRLSPLSGALLALLGCASSGVGGDAGVSADGATDAALDADLGSDGGSDGGVDASFDAPALSAEVCDGVDNDGNGIADDVDVGGDGICDCLLIATLGVPGVHGDGDVFSAWLDGKSDVGAVSLGDQELTSELLAPYQVIVAEDMRGREYSDAEVAALQGWIEGGGGLMTLIGYGSSSERTNINQLLAPTGISYDETPILSGSPTVPITTWHDHAVSAGVTQVGVDNGYEVIGAGEVVAEEGGFVVLRAGTLGEGKVLVWGDEWITYDSEWTEHPEYQLERFWLNVLKWLTPETECQVPILI